MRIEQETLSNKSINEVHYYIRKGEDMGRFKTDSECIQQMEYVNIPAWHKAGYLGKGLTVFCDDVLSDGHAVLVKEIVETILPEARVLTGAIGFAWEQRKSFNRGREVECNNRNEISDLEDKEIVGCAVKCTETGEIMMFDDFIKKYQVSLINNSTDGGAGTRVLPQAAYMKKKIQEHNLIFCGAAGNGYGQATTQKYNDACIIVTSVKLEDGKPKYGHKAHGENIDFSMFYGFQPGTSHSSPFLLGVAGLLRCRWPGMKQEEVYEYFKDHCIHLGPRRKFGWGLPVLGEPK